MTPAVLTLIEPILRSPLLADITETLNARLREEAARRRQFYEEMRDDEKVEFIEGEVVMLSPARNAHLLVRDNIHYLMRTFVPHQATRRSTRREVPLCLPTQRLRTRCRVLLP